MSHLKLVKPAPCNAALATFAFETLCGAATRLNCSFLRLDEWRLVCAELLVEHHDALTTKELTAIDWLIADDEAYAAEHNTTSLQGE